jgi:hypothetical protein
LLFISTYKTFITPRAKPMAISLISGNFDSESVLEERLFLQPHMTPIVAMKSNSNSNDHWVFDAGNHLGRTTAGMTSPAVACIFSRLHADSTRASR